MIFLVVVITAIYIFYPKVNVSVNGNLVKFDSVDADIIIVSENPDFTNPTYLDLKELNNASFRLKPGTYYWKADNGIIEGMKNKIVIKSEVGLGINRGENETDLVNIGNVKINVTKNENGIMVGHIILEPDENEKIEDENETYTGKEEK